MSNPQTPPDQATNANDESQYLFDADGTFREDHPGQPEFLRDIFPSQGNHNDNQHEELGAVSSDETSTQARFTVPSLNSDYEIQYEVDENGYIRRDEAGQLMIFRRSSLRQDSHSRSEREEPQTASSDQATDGDSPRFSGTRVSDNAVLGEHVPGVADEGGTAQPTQTSGRFSYQETEQNARNNAFVAKLQLAIYAYLIYMKAPKVPHDRDRALEDDRPSPPLQASIPTEALPDHDLNDSLDQQDYDPEQIDAYIRRLELNRVLLESAELAREGSDIQERLEEANARGNAEGEAEFNRKMREFVERRLPPQMRVAPSAPAISRQRESHAPSGAAQAPESEADLEAQDEANLQRALRESAEMHRRYNVNSDEVVPENSSDEEDEGAPESSSDEEEEALIDHLEEPSAESHEPHQPNDDNDTAPPRSTLEESVQASVRPITDRSEDIAFVYAFEAAETRSEAVSQLFDGVVSERIRQNGSGEIQGQEQLRLPLSLEQDPVSELELGEAESSSEESETIRDSNRLPRFVIADTERPFMRPRPAELTYFVRVPFAGGQSSLRSPTALPIQERGRLYRVTVEMPPDFDSTPEGAHALSLLQHFLRPEQLDTRRPAPPPSPPPTQPRRLDPAERNQVDDESITTPRSLELIDAMMFVLNEHRGGQDPVRHEVVRRLYTHLGVPECIRFSYWLRAHGYDTDVILEPQERDVVLQLIINGMIFQWAVSISGAAQAGTEVRESSETPLAESSNRPSTDNPRTEASQVISTLLGATPGPETGQIYSMLFESRELREAFIEQLDVLSRRLERLPSEIEAAANLS